MNEMGAGRCFMLALGRMPCSSSLVVLVSMNAMVVACVLSSQSSACLVIGRTMRVAGAIALVVHKVLVSKVTDGIARIFITLATVKHNDR